MKKYTTLLFVIASFQIFAVDDFYKQLCDFNYNWGEYYAHISKQEAIEYSNDIEYIQTHLGQVIPILKSNPVSHLNYKQKVSRIRLIKFLEEYKIAGLFPVNNYREDRIPVFIDEYNTHCAVGHLLEKSGHEALAQRIAKTNNYAWVKEITNPELIKWQKTSGLTVEELKLIQGAYDFYPVLNIHDPNKYEIPQKPEFMILFFERKKADKTAEKKVWCKGEGKNGILHGRWEQNYSEVLPWIVGYFNKGKRTGQWKEYYQGTNKLCRTENWRNNKLNGVRKRFNKAGIIIEEILFKNGNAFTKTNYDLNNSLKFIRTPIDSNSVWTDVYTIGGSILAAGKERIHNPGNLMWFQNIELTALNTAAITSRDLQKTGNTEVYMNPESGTGLYNAPPLVEYKKEGHWVYYKDYTADKIGNTESVFHTNIYHDYPYLETNMRSVFNYVKDQKSNESFDSIIIKYTDNNVNDFIGFAENKYLHLVFQYHPKMLAPLFINDIYSGQGIYYGHGRRSRSFPQLDIARIKMVGKYNEKNERIGTWKYYNTQSRLCKSETYIIPQKEFPNINLASTK